MSHHIVGTPTKVVICHHTGSVSNPTVTIEVDEEAVAAHIAEHGDTVGPCGSVSRAKVFGVAGFELVFEALAERAAGFDTVVTDSSTEYALIAIQGPKSVEILSGLESELVLQPLSSAAT